MGITCMTCKIENDILCFTCSIIFLVCTVVDYLVSRYRYKLPNNLNAQTNPRVSSSVLKRFLLVCKEI